MRPFAVLVLCFWLAVLTSCDIGPKGSFKATDVTGTELGREFALTDHNGAARRLTDFKGKVVVMFFGFTHCPDVCPTTLAQMAKVMMQLGENSASRVQVLFVTVDPERDTQDVLKNYITAFNPNFLGLRGDQDALSRTAKEFKLVIMKNAETSPGNYSVDHSTQTFVYDRQNRLRLFVTHGQIEEALAHDIDLLLKQD